MTRCVLTLTGLCIFAASAFAEERPVVRIWPGDAPGETGEVGEEKAERGAGSRPVTRISNVTVPTLTLYKPPKDKDTGAAVVICPGGGYNILAWDLEGEEVAAWLNSIGITGVVLKYRVPRRPDEPKGEPARRPVQDAQHAISLVRSKAREWRLDPQRIGVIGFSAGGHLAIATATNFDRRAYQPIDGIDEVSCRPDFAIPVYSGYLKAADKDELAAGIRTPPNTPPVFVLGGVDNGGMLHFSGTNGMPDSSYRVFMTTNLGAVSVGWAPVLTNAFDGTGAFEFTVPVEANVPQAFYRLSVP